MTLYVLRSLFIDLPKFLLTIAIVDIESGLSRYLPVNLLEVEKYFF